MAPSVSSWGERDSVVELDLASPVQVIFKKGLP